jgi:hypothetical protein
MDSALVSVGKARLRRRILDFLDRNNCRDANERAVRSLRGEIDDLDRTGILEEILRDLKMTRRDIGATLNADPKTDGSRKEMSAWRDLAHRLQVDRWPEFSG